MDIDRNTEATGTDMISDKETDTNMVIEMDMDMDMDMEMEMDTDTDTSRRKYTSHRMKVTKN
jgi:hypothetical protein